MGEVDGEDGVPSLHVLHRQGDQLRLRRAVPSGFAAEIGFVARPRG